jgi:hypothetical protein
MKQSGLHRVALGLGCSVGMTLLVGMACCRAQTAVLAQEPPRVTATLAAQAPAKPGEFPLLAYVQEARGNFELRLFNPADGASERLELRPERPQVIVWRTDRPEVVTVSPAGAYAIRYRPKPNSIKSVGDPAPAGVTPRDGWIGRDGKVLQVVASAATATGGAQCALYEVPVEGPWRRLSSAALENSANDEECESFALRNRPP